jgi:hypothetical protein
MEKILVEVQNGWYRPFRFLTINSNGVVSMFKAYSVAMTIVFILICHSTARSDLIDFEQFNVGDGVAEINAVYNPLGINFVTEGGAGQIQLIGSNKVFAAFTPDSNQFDILINFSFHIDEITADFLNNGGTDAFSVLEGYNVNKTSNSDASGYIFGDFGDANISLGWTYPGPGPFSPVRTLHLSQDLADTNFVTIDNVGFAQVPEPASTGLLILTAVAAVFLRRKKHELSASRRPVGAR